MSEASRVPLAKGRASDVPAANGPSILDVFLAFLFIGATSFGGGIVAYLRSELVGKHHWVDDREFLELLSISQTLPGLNATNMAVLVGDRLRGTVGSVAALVGIGLPGAILMYVVGIVYHAHGSRPLTTAALKGVAAAAVGLLLATTAELGRKSLTHASDMVFVLITVLGVNWLHQSVPRVLMVVGALAILWYRPGSAAKQSGEHG